MEIISIIIYFFVSFVTKSMYIRRKIHQDIKKHLSRKEYTIITGPRQSGKTSLLQAIYRELESNGDVVSYLTFEDRDILTAINDHPEEVFSFVPRPAKYLNSSDESKKPVFLFIDEVQYAADPSNFLKYLYYVYNRNLKIIATGSSAFYLDQKFKDSLSGRKRVFKLQTLTFEEWLVFKNLDRLSGELKIIQNRNDYISPDHRELREMFDEYLIFGGYPEVALENNSDEKIKLLKDIRDSFLKRDIDESGVSNPDKFYNLLALLAGQTGNLVNRNELANTIGVDNKTIQKYLFVLENCFHIELIKPFYSNLRKELTKMPKIYFMDSGLRNSSLNRFFDFNSREDQGVLIENYIHKRLTEQFDSDLIRFWRTTDNNEIDFIISTSFNEGLAYEVKLKCKSGKSTSIKKFTENYPTFTVEVISYDLDRNCKWILKL
ncbi:MAG: ATP-binding protein [Bacteroidales bacterium]|nr:ATP-binding protein [Bacteroidales bacterium]